MGVGMTNERSQVSDATREAEAEEARAAHVPDGPAGSDEEAVEERKVDDGVREHYREMTALGANDPGEGRIP
jgi:hypothetical protein